MILDGIKSIGDDAFTNAFEVIPTFPFCKDSTQLSLRILEISLPSMGVFDEYKEFSFTFRLREDWSLCSSLMTWLRDTKEKGLDNAEVGVVTVIPVSREGNHLGKGWTLEKCKILSLSGMQFNISNSDTIEIKVNLSCDSISI